MQTLQRRRMNLPPQHVRWVTWNRRRFQRLSTPDPWKSSESVSWISSAKKEIGHSPSSGGWIRSPSHPLEGRRNSYKMAIFRGNSRAWAIWWLQRTLRLIFSRCHGFEKINLAALVQNTFPQHSGESLRNSGSPSWIGVTSLRGPHRASVIYPSASWQTKSVGEHANVVPNAHSTNQRSVIEWKWRCWTVPR